MNVLLTVLLIQQGLVALRGEMERRDKYAASVTTALHARKPVLVVGGPWGTSPVRKLFGVRAHGCGDICSDVDPMACAGCSFVPGDIRALPFTDKQFGAVFCSHVLEHMDNVQDVAHAWKELHRMADSVFVLVPGKDSLGGWLAPDHHLWVKEVSTTTLIVEERPTGNIYLVYSDGRYAPTRDRENVTMRRHGIRRDVVTFRD